MIKVELETIDLERFLICAVQKNLPAQMLGTCGNDSALPTD